MKKITELTEVKWHTVETIDAYGTRHRDYEEYDGRREVRTIGQGLRFVHYVVDGMVFFMVLSTIQLFIGLIETIVIFSQVLDQVFSFFAVFVVIAFYPGFYTLCEYLWQKTPGKFLTNSWVVDEYGNRPELRIIILRSVIRFVPFEPFSCMGDESYGWHDRWSNTWVVSNEELQTIKRLQAEQSENRETIDTQASGIN